MTPPASVQRNARLGLELRKKFGRGGTAVGVARARDLSNGKSLSAKTIGRMVSYFARHAVDREAKGDESRGFWGRRGNPSAGWIAWLLWGGDAGRRWANAQWKKLQKESWEECLEIMRALVDELFQEVTTSANIAPFTKTTLGTAERSFVQVFYTKFVKAKDENDDPKTPAPPKDRVKGSPKNKPGSASTKGTSKITISPATEKGLTSKVKAHNDKHGDKAGKRVTLRMLKAVYRRGAGAFSTSHRPSVSSRAQWAMARVNAFLRLVRTGRPSNPKYTTDNDLLPKGHPRKSS